MMNSSPRKRRRDTPWVAEVLTWFSRNRRPMPWRSRPTPYRVWISEIMLQQTQVDTVIPYYRRFMARFPSLRALAAADLQDVLKQWEGLGYYTRARSLHRAARIVAAERRGRLPRSAEGLLTLPGIGPYTAAAVASICFGQPVPAVDGNVLRVFARFLGIRESIASGRTRRRIAERLADAIPAGSPGDFNQALMEIGALLCRPRAPACSSCPLKAQCVACRTDAADRIPVKRNSKKVPHCDWAAGMVMHRGRLLVRRRPTRDMLGGLWEIPGGQRGQGEPAEEAARRHVLEKTGIRIRVGPACCTVKHAYSHFRITLHAFECRATSTTIPPEKKDTVLWASKSQVAALPFDTASRRALDAARTRRA